MIGFLRGKVLAIDESKIILEVNGIGFEINVAASFINHLTMEQEDVEIYTYTDLKENQIQLFGFKTIQEKMLFNKLIEVNGIGPKMAISMMSALSLEHLVAAICAEDFPTLIKLPGIGKKTAQRMVLELKDKLAKSSLAASIGSVAASKVEVNLPNGNTYYDALEALLGLGYNQNEIEACLKAVYEDNKNESIDQLLKLTLKQLAIK